MADDVKPLDGGNNAPDGDIAKLTKQVEDLQKALAEKDAAVTELEGIKAEAIKTRQEAKERERKALEEQGQYKTVAEMQADEIKKLKERQAELEKSMSDVEDTKKQAEQWKAYQDQRRKALLEMLPEGNREKFQNAPLELLEETVTLVTGDSNIGTFKGGGSHSGAGGTEGKKYSEWTNEQRREFNQTHTPEEIAAAMAR